MKVDVEAKQCAGIDLEWDCENQSLCCSVEEHITTTVEEFEHALPKQQHHGPSKAVTSKHRTRVQHIEEDNSRKPPPDEIKKIQKVVGEFSFPARAVDNKIPHALNKIACDVTKKLKRLWKQHCICSTALLANPNQGSDARQVT